MSLSRKRDGTYTARYWTNGKQPGSQRVQVTLGKLKPEEAKRRYAELLTTKTRKGAAQTEHTFSDFLTIFEERYTSSLKAVTAKNQKSKFIALRKLSISALPLHTITPVSVVAAINEISKLTLMDSTKFNYKVLLKTILKRAYKWKHIRSDVWDEAELTFKRPDKGSPKFLSYDEWNRFITCLNNEDEWLATEFDRIGYDKTITPAIVGYHKRLLEQHRMKLPVFKMLLFTASRISEIVSLRWSDIDYENNVINILQTKSGNFKKTPLNEDVLAVLEEAGGYQGNDDAYIFTSDGENPFDTQAIRNTFHMMCLRASLPDSLKVHSLRHTAASWLTMADTPTPAVQELLGHSDIKSTLIYSHLSKASLHGMSGRIGEAARTAKAQEVATSSSQSERDALVPLDTPEKAEIRKRLKGLKSLQDMRLQIFGDKR